MQIGYKKALRIDMFAQSQDMLFILKSFIETSPRKDLLTPFFGVNEKDSLEAISLSRKIPTFNYLKPFSWMETIHFSWFLIHLKSLPKPSQALFLGILPKETLRKILAYFPQLKPNFISLPFMQTFISHILKLEIKPKEILELEQLPAYPLDRLLDFTKLELEKIVDFLGIHDLAIEVRKIVDKKKLASIYAALTKTQLQFLQSASKQQIKGGVPKLGLENLDITAEHLRLLLHQRGLIRLGIAISDAHASFIWHLLHHFDTGRAKFIQKTLKQRHNPDLVSHCQGQVLHLINRYKP